MSSGNANILSSNFVGTYECACGKLALSEETSTLEADLEDDATSTTERNHTQILMTLNSLKRNLFHQRNIKVT